MICYICDKCGKIILENEPIFGLEVTGKDILKNTIDVGEGFVECAAGYYPTTTAKFDLCGSCYSKLDLNIEIPKYFLEAKKMRTGLFSRLKDKDYMKYEEKDD